jgi:CHAT domain-containing protein
MNGCRVALFYVACVSLFSHESFANALPLIESSEQHLKPAILWNEGRYQALVDDIEPRSVSDYPENLDFRCSASLLLGLYNDFFECMRVWETTSFPYALGRILVREGAETRRRRWGMLTINRTGEEDVLEAGKGTSVGRLSRAEVEGRKHRLLAEAWFQLGDYQSARRYARLALKAYDTNSPFWRPDTKIAWYRDVPAPGGRLSSHWIADIILSASLAAQSAIRLGKDEEVAGYLSVVEGIHQDSDGGEPTSGFSRFRHTQRNVINFSAGKFDGMAYSAKSADEYLEDITGLSLMVMGGAIAVLGRGQGTEFSLIGYRIMARDNSEAFLMREAFQNAIIANHRKDWDNALNYLEDVLSNESVAYFSELQQLALQQKGLALVQLNRPDEALVAFDQAITIIEQSRGNVSTEAQKLGYFGNKNLPYQESIKILLNRNEDAAAFAMAERARSRVLVDMLADSQARRGQLPDSLAPVDLQLASNDTTSSREAAEPIALRSRALRRASPSERRKVEAKTMTNVQAYSAADLQQLLSPDELLVEYMQLGEQWVAFKVTADNVEAVTLDPGDLAERIEQYRRDLQQAGNTTYRNEAQALYRDLVAPLTLPANQALTIVPSGALNYLPFSTLHDGEQYLLQQRVLKLLPSATSKAFLQSKQSTPRLLALGNPTGDLPGAAAEVAALAQGFSGSTVVKREQATETLLKQRGGEFNMLHIASHGVFDPADPGASRLLLAADASNDGDLTMAEIYGLELDANLVVLSACETGLNEIKNGEEIFGLTRGFLYAGSSNIVASLWKVDDIATKSLMANFYQGLSTKPYAEALRDAQLSLQGGDFSHPFYWAAFQLTGEG